MARWWKAYFPSDYPDTFDTDLTNAFLAAAKSAIPHISRNRLPLKNCYFFSPRMKEMNHRVNRCRKPFRRNRTQANFDALRHVIRHASDAAAEEREAMWLEWGEGLNRHTTLTELWSRLRRSTGGKTSPPPAHSQPGEEEERLIHSFSERASTSQLPDDVQRLQDELRPLRLERIRRAIGMEDSTDHPFTLQELKRAEKGGDTAPGEDGVTFSVPNHAGPTGASAFLALVYSRSARRLPGR